MKNNDMLCLLSLVMFSGTAPSGKHKIKSAVFLRLLNQTKEVTKKSNRDYQSDKHIKRKIGKGR